MVPAAVIGLRYELAIMLAKNEDESIQTLSLCWLLTIGLSVALFLMIQAVGPGFCQHYHLEAIQPYLWCVPLFTFLWGVDQACNYWLTHHKAFKVLAIGRFSRSAFTVGTQMAAWSLLGGGYIYLVAGSFLGQFAATAILLGTVVRRGGRQLVAATSLVGIKKAFVEHRNYPLYVAPYAFAVQFSKRLVFVLLAMFTGSAEVGLFAMAMQVAFIPVTFVSASLNQVFYKKVVSEIHTERLETFVVKTLTRMVFCLTPYCLFAAFNSSTVLGLALGESWMPAGPYAAALAAPAYFLFLTSWLDRVYDAVGWQRLAVVLQIGYDAVSLGLFFAVLKLGYSPLAAVSTYCGVTAIYNVVWLAVTFRVASFSLVGLGRLVPLAITLGTAAVGAHFLIRLSFNHQLGIAIELTLIVVLHLSAFLTYKGVTNARN